MNTLLKTIYLTTATALLSFSSFAEEVPKETKPAEPLSSVTLPFPPELRITGNEGWVQLSYIIDKEGNVKEPIIEASIGGPAFEKTAKEALNNLKYAPALYKGSAVMQSVTGEVVEFLLDQTFEGVDQGFTNSYAELASMFNNNNYSEGSVLLEKLALSQDLTLQELSLIEVLRSYSAAQRKDHQQQLQHLRNASVRDGRYLSKEMLATVLQSRFILASKKSLFNEAITSYNLLEQLDPLNDNLTTLALMIAPMQKAIESGQLIQVSGEIGTHGHFTYHPMRNTVAFNAADEGVKEIEPRCERKSQRFTVNTQNEWTIPKSWGDCSIVIYGTPGAKFDLLELAEGS